MAFRRSSVRSRPAPPINKFIIFKFLVEFYNLKLYFYYDAYIKVTLNRSFIFEDTTMSRLSLFNSPFLLGFDQFERTIDRISKLSSDSYPPYNIEQISSTILRITIAVAGFEKNELDISLEGNQLLIRGSRTESDSEKIYIHRGIATRQFQRNFVLAEGIKVEGATIENGLLNIDLVQPVSQEQSKKIEIKDSSLKVSKKNLINLNLQKKE